MTPNKALKRIVALSGYSRLALCWAPSVRVE
jgi:hypothetical protein